MSALAPKSDIGWLLWDVRFAQGPEQGQPAEHPAVSVENAPSVTILDSHEARGFGRGVFERRRRELWAALSM